VALPGFARRTPLLQQSLDVSCPPGPQQQTCSGGFAAAGMCAMLGQTDGRTPYRFVNAGSHTMRAMSVNETTKLAPTLGSQT